MYYIDYREKEPPGGRGGGELSYARESRPARMEGSSTYSACGGVSREVRR